MIGGQAVTGDRRRRLAAAREMLRQLGAAGGSVGPLTRPWLAQLGGGAPGGGRGTCRGVAGCLQLVRGGKAGGVCGRTGAAAPSHVLWELRTADGAAR